MADFADIAHVKENRDRPVHKYESLPKPLQDVIEVLISDGCCYGISDEQTRIYVLRYVGGRMVVMRSKELHNL